MTLYAGIDLHSTNSVVVIQNQEGKVVARDRLPNDLGVIRAWLEPYQDDLESVAVESTYNWYWLVDGLRESEYDVRLVNTAAIQQYQGLKYGDDDSDARWLGTMLRLGVLREGHIYPKEERAVRDLARKRSQLVRQCTSHILSVENLFMRNTGGRISANTVKRLTDEDVDAVLPDPNLGLAVKSSLAVMGCLLERIHLLETAVLKRIHLRDEFKGLLSVPGIGKILGLTIMLETGEISRFKRVGNYVSYCRCVRSVRLSNSKKKGKGNAKNGNRYLSWAFAEAAIHALRCDPRIKRFYQRKLSKTNRIVGLRTVAHKLARACYHIMKDGQRFDVMRAFG